ncbi:MAG: hypothetical protein ACXQTD_09610 [Candidatus Syntropharchaeia archaeon]
MRKEAVKHEIEDAVLRYLCISRQEIPPGLLEHIVQRCQEESEKYIEDVIQEMETEGWFSWWKNGDGAVLGYSSGVE